MVAARILCRQRRLKELTLGNLRILDSEKYLMARSFHNWYPQTTETLVEGHHEKELPFDNSYNLDSECFWRFGAGAGNTPKRRSDPDGQYGLRRTRQLRRRGVKGRAHAPA